MQLGMIGLGRMGANLVRRLQAHGHECVVFDVNSASVTQLEGEGAIGATSLADFVGKLSPPRAACIMVPAAFAGTTVQELAPRGIHYVDVGTSGGVFGLRRGFCLMIGGENEVVERLDPIFRALAPGLE